MQELRKSQLLPTFEAKRALRFVVLIGVVNLFADMTYEGSRGLAGAFLGSLGASGFVVGTVAGGGELFGYAIRSVSGAVADRTGRYWIEVWAGYAINVLCVPALALAGNWPAAAGLVVGERFGRGVRRPVVSAVISEAGTKLGGGWAFGLNETLDQVGATVGPLIAAWAFAYLGGFRPAFGVLIVPAVLTLAFLAPATIAARGITPPRATPGEALFRDPKLFRRYAIGGALIAAGYVDFALIAYRFNRDHIDSGAMISVWFAVAMALAAVSAPILGRLFDRFGTAVVAGAVVVTAAASPLAFLGTGAWANAGAAVWGIGTAVQDSLLMALVATIVSKRRQASAFGVYDTIFGVAWFAGSALMGFLADRSVGALVAFSVIAQLAALPCFWSPPRTSIS